MNRVDVIELVVDLDVDLVDVILAGSLCDGPRSVILSFVLVAPTCFIYFWPRLVIFLFCPDLFYLLFAPTCFIFVGPDLFYCHFDQGQPRSVLPASW